MISGSSSDLDPAGLLAAARAAKATENAAAARVLAAAVDWAHLHTVDDLDDAATWWSGSRTMGQDTGIPIAGSERARSPKTTRTPRTGRGTVTPQLAHTPQR